MTAPVGLSDEPTTLTATKGPQPPTKLVFAVALLDSIEVTLGTGQPLKPLELTYTFAAPLPRRVKATLVRGDLGRDVVTPLTSRLSADRTTLTATSDHLSQFSVITEGIEPAVAGFLGTRGAPPTCEGAKPAWVSEVVFLPPRGDPPLLVCSGADPANPNVSVVKLTNNRGTGLQVTTSVNWRWQWSTGAGGLKSTAKQWMTNITTPSAARTLYVMPGQQLHLGFDRPRGATSIIVHGELTIAAFAYGVAWQALEELKVPAVARTAMAGTFLGVCLIDAVADPLARAEAVDLAKTISTIATCGITNYNDIVTLTRAAVPSTVWATISPTLYSHGAKQAVLRRLNGLLTIASAFWQVSETALGLIQDPYSRRVEIFAVPSKPAINKLRLSTSGLGPVILGQSTNAAAEADVITWNAKACEPFDPPSGRWEANYPGATESTRPFTLDDDADQSTKMRHARVTRIDVTSPVIRTTTNIHVGSSLTELRAAYGSRLRRTDSTGTSEVWAIAEGARLLAFELWMPGNYAGEKAGVVAGMRVGPLTLGQTVFGTDDIAGGC